MFFGGGSGFGADGWGLCAIVRDSGGMKGGMGREEATEIGGLWGWGGSFLRGEATEIGGLLGRGGSF